MDETMIMHRLPKEIRVLADDFLELRCRYQSALREVRTKLEILDDEFQMRHSRNPIHHMESRIKRPQSIAQKLLRKELPITPQSAMENLYDIAGIRVVCAYLNDIYTIADLLIGQDDIRLIRSRDYIKEPKENGYRSLHLIVEVPVFLSGGKILLPVEVQIRTIAMDFWASLEHQIRYKEVVNAPEELNQELFDAAKKTTALDQDMQRIHDHMVALVREQPNVSTEDDDML
ncbi:MAG: GTP pyrophosphokinase family protein [Clostridia bacterium]